MSLIFTWLRLSTMRQLDWYRNRCALFACCLSFVCEMSVSGCVSTQCFGWIDTATGVHSLRAVCHLCVKCLFLAASQHNASAGSVPQQVCTLCVLFVICACVKFQFLAASQHNASAGLVPQQVCTLCVLFVICACMKFLFLAAFQHNASAGLVPQQVCTLCVLPLLLTAHMCKSSSVHTHTHTHT